MIIRIWEQWNLKMKWVFCNWAMGRRTKKWNIPSVGKMCRCVVWSCYITWRVREEMFIQLSEQVLEWSSQLQDTKLNIISARRKQATDLVAYSCGDVFTQLWRMIKSRKSLSLELFFSCYVATFASMLSCWCESRLHWLAKEKWWYQLHFT